MSFDQWLLSLHVLSAALMVAGIVLFWVLIVSGRNIDTPEDTLRVGPIAKVGNAAVGIGMGGTIILGVVLAFSYGGYDIWDGWIIAAIVLWAISGWTGAEAGKGYGNAGMEAQRLAAEGTPISASVGETFGPSRAFKMHLVSNVAILLLLLDMIWKPGA